MSTMGQIEVITGSMFSGKTEELIRRVRRAIFARQQVQAFKPRADDRYDKTHIVSHGEISIEAVPVPYSRAILNMVEKTTEVLAIDEAQFFDDSIITVVNSFANRGLRVIVAGLDQDFRGEPFGPMPALMAIAEEVTKVRAICSMCGQEASRSQRIVPDEGLVRVGGADAYEARCRACHSPNAIRAFAHADSPSTGPTSQHIDGPRGGSPV
jgi:thymidine kinase